LYIVYYNFYERVPLTPLALSRIKLQSAEHTITKEFPQNIATLGKTDGCSRAKQVFFILPGFW
jgi:hypothetical protein